MAKLTVREIETEIIRMLEQRAEEHHCSVEEEHRAILRAALLVNDTSSSTLTFESYLRTMPDVGTDADFTRIEGTIRDIQ